MQFTYEAMATTGAVQRGTVEAPSEAEALARVEGMGLLPMTVRARRSSPVSRLLTRRPSGVQVADTVRNLADLLSTGGVPLLQALGALQSEEPNEVMRGVLAGLARAINDGRSLGAAMAEYPEIFPQVCVRIIAASEARGDLDRALSESARYLERGVATTSRIRGALAYPGFVVLVALGVVIFMSVSVLPKLASMFRESGLALPITTRLLMAFGQGLGRFWYLTLLAAVGAVLGVRWLLRQSAVQGWLDRLAWTLPGLRIFTRNFAYARWTLTVGLMHSSGVPLLETLALAHSVAGNRVFSDALAGVPARVRDGEALSSALRRTGIMPGTIIQLTALGEEHGTLGDMLMRIGRRYEVNTERLLEKLPAFIEPAFIAVIGVIIGGLLLSMYYPIVNLYQVAARGH